MYYKSKYDSPLGTITIASDEKNIVGLWFDGQKYYEDTIDEELKEKETIVIKQCKKWLDSYFAGKCPKVFDLPLKPKGNEFRQSVWQILLEIPYGKTTTYGEIAQEVAFRLNKSAMSAQAVGNAVGHNPISIIIPCHRVIGANGSLTGYAGGFDRKTALLKIENIDF